MPLIPPGNPVATQQAQATGVYQGQSIHDIKFATRTIAAGVIPAITNFFSGAPAADPVADRYEQGNTLVTSMKAFTVYAVGFQLIAGAAGTTGVDMQAIIERCCLRLITNQKEFGVFPVHLLGAGGGVSMQSGQVAVTAAALPGAFSPTGITNGLPLNSNLWPLANPLEISANQPFYAELLAPTAAGLLGAITLTGAVICRLILSGVEDRAAS